MNYHSQEQTLLDKLGGEDALVLAIDKFYDRLSQDPKLRVFFAGTQIRLLKFHQYKFMTVAFTSIPKDLDVGDLIYSKHRHLFEKGLNETHFDIVAGHFVATLRDLHVPENLIDEAVGIIGPLRPIFVKGAEDAVSRAKGVEENEASIIACSEGN